MPTANLALIDLGRAPLAAPDFSQAQRLALKAESTAAGAKLGRELINRDW
jgi:hypothetical protein